MSLHLTLYQLAARHRLSPRALTDLQRLAGVEDHPPALLQRLALGAVVAGATLAGLGLVFWVAANWDHLGRGARFAVLQLGVALPCAYAVWRPSSGVPAGLLALAAIGALLAFFGQTYQTGADPWQLFAMWAGLALPLALGLRSDVLWTPWGVVMAVAISLWVHAQAGHGWQADVQTLPAHAAGWTAALVLAAALQLLRLRGWGAGPWSVRTAWMLAAAMITFTGVLSLLREAVAPQYALALVLLSAWAVLLARRRALFDLVGLSVVVLAIDTLLVAGLARLLFEGDRGADPIGRLLLLGLVATALLAVSVTAVLRLSRRGLPPRQEHPAR